jgi:hypothetical protein
MVVILNYMKIKIVFSNAKNLTPSTTRHGSSHRDTTSYVKYSTFRSFKFLVLLFYVSSGYMEFSELRFPSASHVGLFIGKCWLVNCLSNKVLAKQINWIWTINLSEFVGQNEFHIIGQ